MAMETPKFGVSDGRVYSFFAAAALRCRTVLRRSGSIGVIETHRA